MCEKHLSEEHLNTLYKEIWGKRENSDKEEIIALSEGACSKKTKEDLKYRIKFVILNLIDYITKDRKFDIVISSNFNFAVIYEDFQGSLSIFNSSLDKNLDSLINLQISKICNGSSKLHDYEYWHNIYCIDNEGILQESQEYKTNVQDDIRKMFLNTNKYRDSLFYHSPPYTLENYSYQTLNRPLETPQYTDEPIVNTYHEDLEKYKYISNRKGNIEDFAKECYREF